MPEFDFVDRVQVYVPGAPLAEVPARPGIYLLFDEKRRIRRMVTTRDLRARARYYLHERDEGDSLSVARREAAALGWIETFSRFETQYAHLLLFRAYFPDAYQALYRLPTPHLLRVTTGEAYPRLVPARMVREGNDVHFGPYLHREMVEEEVNFVNDLLELRRCDYEIRQFHPYERCLYLQMRTCVAPCDRFEQPAYYALAEQAVALLSGDAGALLEALATKRDAAAEDLRFEEAVRWRDRLKQVERWLANRPPFLRLLDALNLVIPQRTEFGVDLFVVREGAMAGWLRLSEPSVEQVEMILAETFSRAWAVPSWRERRDDFAFVSRWLWNREYNAHVIVDDPAIAADEVMTWLERASAEIAEEGTGEDLPIEETA